MRSHFGIFRTIAWFIFVALYLLFVGKTDWTEAAAGAAAAALTLYMLRLLHDKFKRPLLMEPRWFLILWRVPIAMITESWQLLVALVQQLRGIPVDGVFIEKEYPEKEDEHDAARRAYMTFGVCITPNSYLVHQDREKKQVLIRQLVGKDLSTVDRVFVETP